MPYNIFIMFNVILTSTCNLSCNYCFAEKFMGEDTLKNLPPERLITAENFQYILKFLAESKVKHLSLLGGEPTLHPEFNKFARLTISEGLYCSVKTNAMWNRPFTKLFEGIPFEGLNLHVNVNGPEHLNPKQWEKVQANIREARKYCDNIVMQINVSNLNFRYEEILNFAKEVDVRSITWSPAVPIYNYSANESLKKENYSKTLTHRLMQMFEMCSRLNLPIMGVHGPTPCMFSKEQKSWMEDQNISINSHCFPVFDIFPDLSTHYCFPLKDFQKNINIKNFKNLKEVEYELQKEIQLIRPKMFPWKECVDCEFALNNTCQGGCMASSSDMTEFLNRSTDILDDIPHKVLSDDKYENKKFLRWDFEKEFLLFQSQYPDIYKKIISLIDSKRTVQEIIDDFDSEERLPDYIQLIIKNMLFERFIVLKPRKTKQMQDNPFK